MNTLSRGYLPPTLPRNPEPHPRSGANLQVPQAPDLAATLLLLERADRRSLRAVRGKSGKSGGSGRARAYSVLGIPPLSNSSSRGRKGTIIDHFFRLSIRNRDEEWRGSISIPRHSSGLSFFSRGSVRSRGQNQEV